MTNATDRTHKDDEAARREVLDALLAEAAFDGFTSATLSRAGRATDISGAELSRLFPRGVADALACWSEAEDRAMEEAYAVLNPKPHKIRDKITWLVKTRVEALDWNREAARRAAASMVLPHHAGLGPRLLWRTADSMWRAIDDKSTDFNWYTKRISLSGIYSATLSRWFADDGDAASQEPYAKTWAFLDGRIENLMQFEKLKGQFKKQTPDPEGIVSFLGKLRYGRNAG